MVLTDAAPVPVVGALADAVFAVLALLAVAAAVAAFGAGSGLLAGLVPAVLLVVPAGVNGQSVGVTPLLAGGLLVALLVWLSGPRPTWGGPVAAGLAVALAAGGMAVAPPTRDRVLNWELTLGPVSWTVPDVTVALANDLRQQSNVVAFDFTAEWPEEFGPSGSNEVRFTLATLADFREGTWLPEYTPSDPVIPVSSMAPLGGLAPMTSEDLAAVEEMLDDRAFDVGWPQVTVRIHGLVSTWLPLPHSAMQRVDAEPDSTFDPAEWYWTAASQTATSETITSRGDTSTAFSVPALATDDVYREAMSFEVDGAPMGGLPFPDPASAPEPYAAYLALPGGLPSSIRDTAQEVAAGSSTRLQIAYALQDYFRSGAFAYDEEAPYAPGASGRDSYAVMEALLRDRSGYCVHYASTFDVMARSHGLPTRLAVGYAAQADDGGQPVQVGARQLHAWPEVYMEDIGWLAFEPTPVVAVGVPTPEPIAAAPSPAPELTPAPSTDLPAPDPTVDAPGPAPGPGTAEAGDAAEESGSDGIPWAALLAALPFLLAATPAAIRAVRRRVRLAAAENGTAAAESCWREFHDTVVDLGYLDADGEQPRAPAAAAHLADAVNAARYGAATPTGDPPHGPRAAAGGGGRALEAAIAGLERGATRGAVWRAPLLPRSLAPRAGECRLSPASRTPARDVFADR